MKVLVAVLVALSVPVALYARMSGGRGPREVRAEWDRTDPAFKVIAVVVLVLLMAGVAYVVTFRKTP